MDKLNWTRSVIYEKKIKLAPTAAATAPHITKALCQIWIDLFFSVDLSSNIRGIVLQKKNHSFIGEFFNILAQRAITATVLFVLSFLCRWCFDIQHFYLHTIGEQEFFFHMYINRTTHLKSINMFCLHCLFRAKRKTYAECKIKKAHTILIGTWEFWFIYKISLLLFYERKDTMRYVPYILKIKVMQKHLF